MSRFRCLNPKISGPFTQRCRKCRACLDLLAWRKQTLSEFEAFGSERTWFVTLTFKEVPPNEAAAYVLVQKWLKVVRARLDRGKGEKIRFCCVTEMGGLNGRLHYHLLLFVSHGVLYRDLPPWDHGHWKHNLARRKHIAYVAKYLSKGVKYRASQKLGTPGFTKILDHPMVKDFLAAFPGATVRGLRSQGRMLYIPPAQDKAVKRTPERAFQQEFLAEITKKIAENRGTVSVTSDPEEDETHDY